VASPDYVPGLSELSLRPDDLALQRSARLLLLLEVARGTKLKKALDVERLGYYDFFAANPFALFAREEREGKEIVLAGFSSHDLSYQSSGHRFVTRRGRLQADLAYLVARALVEAAADSEARRVVYQLTEKGLDAAHRFVSIYAQSYRASVGHVLKRLDRLSDSALVREVRTRLEATGQLIDLYGFETEEPGT